MSRIVHSVAADLPSTEGLRTPPHSIEAEQAVLGGLLLDNSTWDQIADRLNDSDFYRQDHQLLFRAIQSLIEAEKPCDAVTLAEALDNQQQLEQAGGLEYIGTLARDTPSAANVRAYADIVRERSVMRELIRLGGELAGIAYNPDGRTPAELIENAERQVFEIAERGSRSRRSFSNVRDLLTHAVDRIDHLFHTQSSITGLPTGLSNFDEMTAGLQRGDLVIVAGRPSMGKTSLAMNIAEHAVIGSKMPVAIFSMEMSGEQLVMRMISSLGRIDQSKLRTGKLDNDDWP